MGLETRRRFENVAFNAIDAIEHAQPAGDNGLELETESQWQRARQRPSRVEHRARARRFERQQRAPSYIGATFRDCLSKRRVQA